MAWATRVNFPANQRSPTLTFISMPKLFLDFDDAFWLSGPRLSGSLPQSNILVIYHGNCCDGFGAAFSAWLASGSRAQYLPYAFDTAPPDVTGKHVFILDFSFPEQWMAQMDQQAMSVTLMDHHQSAVQSLYGFRGCCTRLLFDTSRSGAHLAWRHFHPGKPLPKLLACVEDRDLLAWRIPESRAFLASLDTEERSFESWSNVLRMDADEHSTFLAQGEQLLVSFREKASEFAARGQVVSLLGVNGLGVTAPFEFTNEVGQLLAQRSGTFSMVWHQDGPAVVRVSRSWAWPCGWAEAATRMRPPFESSLRSLTSC